MVTSQDKQRLEDLVAVAAVSDHRTRGDLNGLLEELQRAAVDAKDVPTDVITMNSRADMLDLDSGETITFTLVFPPDAHIEKGKISVLGADWRTDALLSRARRVRVERGRRLRRMKVTKVDYQPEAAV
ncbi:MAG TPA: GreA/GreB family elongation factor [Candidatus Udaeobacter sp.]|jgi:regulator of nucleoside diphosphate kinase|nr:GreA/GreB family elongation factor [Candidatus Udaeobacter sp.]